jgi:hypothetical protein
VGNPVGQQRLVRALLRGFFVLLAWGSAPPCAQAQVEGILKYFDDSADAARAGQPDWSSPIATTTPLMEQRLRVDVDQQHAGNGTNTTVADGGKGLDLIVSPTNEIQIAFPPYEARNATASAARIAGFGDWAFLRVEQRLAASPASQDDYVVTAWLSLQAPTGVKALTSSSWALQPTLAFGKGWGAFDIQGNISGTLPTSNAHALGQQIQSNTAFQYHLDKILWPELEVNWTYYPDGPRAGLNQVFLTPGLAIGRLDLGHGLKFTLGLGYQIALAPAYRAKPLTPAYDNAWLFSTRMNF